MSLEDLFNQVDNLNNDDFEALINHADKQKKREKSCTFAATIKNRVLGKPL